MEVKVVVDVTTEPVSLAEVKSWCRIDADYAADDLALGIMIKGAREKLEKELNLSFAPKTLDLYYNGQTIDIPYAPLISITSLKTAGEDPQDVEYVLNGNSFPTIYIDALYDCYIIYPVGWDNSGTGYNLIYQAGYETLPTALKQALLIQIDYELKNLGRPDVDLSPDALNKAKGFSRNLIIQ